MVAGTCNHLNLLYQPQCGRDYSAGLGDLGARHMFLNTVATSRCPAEASSAGSQNCPLSTTTGCLLAVAGKWTTPRELERPISLRGLLKARQSLDLVPIPKPRRETRRGGGDRASRSRPSSSPIRSRDWVLLAILPIGLVAVYWVSQAFIVALHTSQDNEW